MKVYDIAVFDVDGTLLDTSSGVLEAVKYTINRAGLSPLPEYKLRKFIGPPIQKSFVENYEISSAKAQELAEIFRTIYKKKYLFDAIPYKGIYETLDKLKNENMIIAVATYKRQDYAVEILEHFGFHHYSSILYGADAYNKMTKKDIIEKCLLDSEISEYSNAIMIGDSDNDAVGAEELNMHFLGVTYGFGFHKKSDVLKHKSIGSVCRPLEIIPYLTK